MTHLAARRPKRVIDCSCIIGLAMRPVKFFLTGLFFFSFPLAQGRAQTPGSGFRCFELLRGPSLVGRFPLGLPSVDPAALTGSLSFRLTAEHNYALMVTECNRLHSMVCHRT